ncbi:hypothetical protein [Streptomyces sp. NBC_01465]|uniref:hypothetical protein n=1 Tax=Streptomyces sp. NBC_01465 TaxID=2903878 RepID=UPI002E2FFEF0|nr:hypothetical protein [Streptomyces sp. NBC_01465]
MPSNEGIKVVDCLVSPRTVDDASDQGGATCFNPLKAPEQSEVGSQSMAPVNSAGRRVRIAIVKASDDLAGGSDFPGGQIVMQGSGAFETGSSAFGPEREQGNNHRCQCQHR